MLIPSEAALVTCGISRSLPTDALETLRRQANPQQPAGQGARRLPKGALSRFDGARGALCRSPTGTLNREH
jgi:hypothetical protein